MDSDLQELYQSLIIDHASNPRCFGECQSPTHQGFGDNPLCGDELSISLRISEQDQVEEIKFSGTGCAISIASASLMSEACQGKSVTEINQFFSAFRQAVKGEGATMDLVSYRL